MSPGRTGEKLRCLCCGIGSPDVGFTVDGDVLCDDCEAKTQAHIGALVWAGYIAERGRDEAEREARTAEVRADFVRMVGETFGPRATVHEMK